MDKNSLAQELIKFYQLRTVVLGYYEITQFYVVDMKSSEQIGKGEMEDKSEKYGGKGR